MYFVLYGTLGVHSKILGKIYTINDENTIGEECIFDKRFLMRAETVFADSEVSGTLELSTTRFMNLKEILYENGFKKDFLMIESVLKRNYVLKKNLKWFIQIWISENGYYI